MNNCAHTSELYRSSISLLERASFFKSLPLAQQGRFMSSAVSIHHPKGKILFLQDDLATSFYFIKSGWIKLFRETLDGSQAVIDILNTGHVFAIDALFNDFKYLASAEVVEPAEIISLPLALIDENIKSSPEFSRALLEFMAQYQLRQHNEIEHLALQNAPQRIGCFLLRLADQTRTGAQTIHLPYDKSLVATRLGMQPETFSRALSKLKEEVGLKVSGASIEIDNIEKLSVFTCSACSSEFPCKDRRYL